MNTDCQKLIVRFQPLLQLLMISLLVASCSSNDPVVPDDTISSPDHLMEEFQSALDSKDIQKFEALFDHETGRFNFSFLAEDVATFSLPTTHLNMGEMIQVWRNIFSGQEILNNDGNLVPAITAWEVTRMHRNTEWNDLGYLDSGLWDFYCDVQKVSYHCQFTVSRGGDNPPLHIEGNLEFKVRPPGRSDSWCSGFENFALTGIEDRSWINGDMGLTTFGSLIYQYFTNEAPEIVLEAEADQSNLLKVDANVCQTLNAGSTIYGWTVRWRFEPDGEWTDWLDDCNRSFEYTTYGEKTIDVEVRDRWGLSSTTQQTINLVPMDMPGPWR